MKSVNNPYKTLGVPNLSDIDTVKKAHRALAMELHPDRNAAPEAVARMKEVNEAWDCLKTPERKEHIDRQLRGREHTPFGQTNWNNNPFREKYQNDPFRYAYGNFEEFFGGRRSDKADYINKNLKMAMLTQEIASLEQELAYKKSELSKLMGGL